MYMYFENSTLMGKEIQEAFQIFWIKSAVTSWDKSHTLYLWGFLGYKFAKKTCTCKSIVKPFFGGTKDFFNLNFKAHNSWYKSKMMIVWLSMH